MPLTKEDIQWLQTPFLAPATPRHKPCCEGCGHFESDAINSAAGVGFCQHGHGFFYPREPHWCPDHTARNV